MPVSPQPDQAALRAAWERFTQTGQLAPELNPLVAGSWQRCAPRLNPHRPPRWAALNDAILALTERQSRPVLDIARPIMEDVYQQIEATGALLILVDSTTCLLEMLGDGDLAAQARALGMRRGVFLHENQIGTVAFSSALLDSTPAQFTGAEHFLSAFHGLSSAAAPIFSVEGQPVGAIGLVTPMARFNPYGAGLMFAAARAIENQLQADRLTAEANARATELHSTLNASSEGVLVWNAQGLLMHLNAQAGRMLSLKPAAALGRPVAQSLNLPEPLRQALERGAEVDEMEITFPLPEGVMACLASVRLIRDLDGAPVNYILMLRRIEQVHQLVHRLVGAQARLTLDDLVGESAGARRVRRQALAAADARACVLIQGEAGTGKNVLARAIHHSSRRASGPFLSINCRAVPRELALAEFLGFEEGAFRSGHRGGQPSKFELANGGTLFLDEVDALSLDMQSALLRVIEAGDVIRLGGQSVIPVDVRVIASSHIPLEERAAEGNFRSDLLFRLSSFVITIPPVRERVEDVPILVARLVERLSAQIGHALTLTPAVQAALAAYPWPGNIRELESVMERAALQCDGEPISLEHLPLTVRERRAMIPGKALTEPVRSLSDAEKAAILSAARAAGGNLTRAAQLLGIGRTTLWRRMKEFGLSAADLAPNGGVSK
ncbi:MAG: sigma 54-interacting transcriptional regulator [Anaerolineales bacterium]|nr:sigma 54-interacting transcriptional regulator [Anaerolineales bacterium]